MANKITERDEQGKIVSKELDSETAAAMGRRSHQKRKSTSYQALLKQAGFDEPESAPEHLIILSQIAAGKTSGAVPAMNAFLRLTSQEAETPGRVVVKPGDMCPTCRQYVMPGLQLSADDQHTIEDYIGFIRDRMDKKPGTFSHVPAR